jgi:hypothetical protein
MADAKTTALTNADRLIIEPTDTTMVVDLSDTTMDASGTNVEMELQELVAAGAVGAVPLMKAADAGYLRWKG